MTEFHVLLDLAVTAEDMGELEDRVDDISDSLPLEWEVNGFTARRVEDPA